MLLRKPNIFSPAYKTGIFVNGCFWHWNNGYSYFAQRKIRNDWRFVKIKATIEHDKVAEIDLNILRIIVLFTRICILRKMTFEKTLKDLIVKNMYF